MPTTDHHTAVPPAGAHHETTTDEVVATFNLARYAECPDCASTQLDTEWFVDPDGHDGDWCPLCGWEEAA